MPFCICSASEVFQRCMHELIEELHGMEVIVDGFVVVGFEDNLEEATQNMPRTWRFFLSSEWSDGMQRRCNSGSRKFSLLDTWLPPKDIAAVRELLHWHFPVPQQVPAPSLRHYPTPERANTEGHRQGLGPCTGYPEESSHKHTHTALLQSGGRRYTAM